VSLSADPANDRLHGRITVRDGAATVRTASVSATGARDDGRRHRLVLWRDGGTSRTSEGERAGGQLTLFVDGTAIGTADVSGSVSRDSPFGVHIGQLSDSRAFFTGAIDDVHAWDRALTDAELAAGTAPSADTVLWLPMDRVSGSR
jgi:sialidase-1